MEDLVIKYVELLTFSNKDYQLCAWQHGVMARLRYMLEKLSKEHFGSKECNKYSCKKFLDHVEKGTFRLPKRY